MSFKRLDPQDFLISTDAIVAPAFAGGISTNTGTAQGNSGVSANTFSAFLGNDSKIEFSVAKAEKNGAGSTDVVYKQFANIIEDREILIKAKDDAFTIITSDPLLKKDDNKIIKSILHSRYKENLKYAQIA